MTVCVKATTVINSLQETQVTNYIQQELKLDIVKSSALLLVLAELIYCTAGSLIIISLKHFPPFRQINSGVNNLRTIT